MKNFALILMASALLWGGDLAAADFSYQPAGELVSGSGSGRADDKVYVPDMRFPIEEAPAFLNSQVWGVGGSQGPSGGQCDTRNYSYPWYDNFCESRRWDMPLCPSGTGHQGQDMRASTCDKNVHWAVAAEAGRITSIGTYSVYLVADGGTQHRYLHMEPSSIRVSVGSRVTKGERLGRISNAFGGTPTTIHLHYDLNQFVGSLGKSVYVPTYFSLIRSYETLIGQEAEPCSVIPADGAVVDDSGPCFTAFGNPRYWRDVDGNGTEGQYRWTNAWVNDTPSNWARWNLYFAEAGDYKVEINVVPPHNASKKVRYTIKHGDEETTVEIDQSAHDSWVTLGEFSFVEGGAQSVSVYDNTGESGDDLHITADAVRISPKGSDPIVDGGGTRGGGNNGGSGGGGETTNNDGGTGIGGTGGTGGENPGTSEPVDDSEPGSSSATSSSCSAAGSAGDAGATLPLFLLAAMLGLRRRRRA